MTWTKLDDSFYDCPKIVAGGNVVAGAFARSLSYCGKHNTDGHVPRVVALGLAEGRKRTIQKLLELRLWEENGSGYVIPDYLEFNPSSEKVEAERQAARERMARVRGNK